MFHPDSPMLLDKKICLLAYHELAELLLDSGKKNSPQSSRKYLASSLYTLEFFIDELLLDNEVPFVPRINSGSVQEFDFTNLAERYFRRVPEFIKIVAILPPMYHYSEHIEVFAACSNAMGLRGKELDWSDIWHGPRQIYPEHKGKSAAVLFNTLVARLRQECRSQEIKKKVRERRKEAYKRFVEYSRYVDALFAVCARLVVLRIDLYYKKDYCNQINAQGAVTDLNHLLENNRCNSLFRRRLGYIAKLEYGVEKGIHFHLVFFFDGSQRHGAKDSYFVQQIGEYWVKVITKNRGDYWNVNARRHEFEKKGICGIGEINSHETALISNLKERVVGYLCKSSQFIRPKIGREIRLIRRGNSPKIPSIKPGRPRKVRDQV